MSSDGGRCPKKLYIFFDFVKNEPDDGDRVVVVGEGGGSVMGTPRPDMTLTIDARFMFLLPLLGLLGVRRSYRGPAPYVGEVGDIGIGGVSPRKTSMFFR